ncbi:uncharacterized protein BP01DRAFT_134191 [Aspergillus saccharolyticus JOP 1030-1]|uniref:Transcription factor domain-containing protein n=1 Tax=Aspergillus saccharolyticus JOP 1030-1 TaxID=1450539 RepID=A0A318ZR45_9EURO|nr:hypothetical protein BP01DRAFT_134191 [Aspergillus saccharolyticus JOP 1030-1]PYH42568.1 hypothetical protein BP01DRAFT_134191 [Aspergillus saccharolyticus JOP 1030-1]
MSQGQANAIELSPQSAFSIFGVYWSLRCFVQEPRSADSCLVIDLPDKLLFTPIRGILQSIQLGRNMCDDGGYKELWPNYRFLALSGCWFRVREFVHALHAVEDPLSMLPSLAKLDLHTNACFSLFNSESAVGPCPDPMSLHRSLVSEILHHQCRAVPHLYIYISNLRKHAHHHEFLQLSALIAIRHIFSLTKVVNNLLVTFRTSQLSSIPPFVGFSTYLAASLQLGALVHLHSLPGCRARLLAALRSYALINLFTLNRLRFLWAPAQIMWQKLSRLLSRALISITHIEGVELHAMSIPTTDEITTIELQNFVSGQFSSILSIIDITEPFYIPFEAVDTQVTSRCFSRSNPCVPEAVSEPQDRPMHGRVVSEINDPYQDHLDQLWVNFC